jgi:hypothetical protein
MWKEGSWRLVIVAQQHPNGCVVASLAMVMSLSYQEMHDILAPQVWWHETQPNGEYEWRKGIDFATRGVCLMDALRWLERQGYATQTRYRYEWGYAITDMWPPLPFAPAHICNVETPAGTQHAMVMNAEGKLLDPYYSAIDSWDFYRKVYSVVGIWRVEPGIIR